MVLRQLSDNVFTWFLGKSKDHPKEAAIKRAHEKKHELLLARDYHCGPTSKKPTKIFGSIRNAKRYWKIILKLDPKDWPPIYEIVWSEKKCRLYADLEWQKDVWEKTEEEVEEMFLELVTEALKKTNIVADDHVFYLLVASKDKKGSIHVISPTLAFESISDQARFWNQVYLQIEEKEKVKRGTYKFLDQTEKSYILKSFIDFAVYDKDREIRMPFAPKMKVVRLKDGTYQEMNVRPLIPKDPSIDPRHLTITYLNGKETMIDVSNYPEEIKCRSRNVYSKALVQSICDKEGLEVTVAALCGSLIKLRNKREIRSCPFGNTHRSNNAYLLIEKNRLFFHCHGTNCKGKKKELFRFEDNSSVPLEDQIPFEMFMKDYRDHVNGVEDYNKWYARVMKEINRYCAVIRATKPYVIYQSTYIDKLGVSRPFYKRQFPKEFIESFRNYKTKRWVVKERTIQGVREVQEKQENTAHPIATLWLDYEQRRVFESEDFCPLGTEDPKVFNTFTGLAISHEDAAEKGTQDPTPFIRFIRECICDESPSDEESEEISNDDNSRKLSDCLLDFFAHLIQRPGVKMPVSPVLQGPEGAGKGICVQMLGKIIGERHFCQPGLEDVIGDFNSLIADALLLYLDECFFGGDKKHAGALKRLITEDRMIVNEKYGPKRPASNRMNVAMASNEDWVAPAGATSRRWLLIRVGFKLLSMSVKEIDALANFCPYSFAKFLYERDITKYVPRDIPITDALIEQRARGMDSVDAWWSGVITDDGLKFGQFIDKAEMYSLYKQATSYHPVSVVVFWKELKKYHPFKEERVRVMVSRIRMVRLPERDEARDVLNKKYGGKVVIYDDVDAKEAANCERVSSKLVEEVKAKPVVHLREGKESMREDIISDCDTDEEEL